MDVTEINCLKQGDWLVRVPTIGGDEDGCPGLPGTFNEAVEEYLTTAKWCIGYKKADLGMLVP